MAKSPKQPHPRKGPIRIGFETETVMLHLDQIVPLKLIAKNILHSRRYKQIIASIEAVGIIEPLVVAPDKQVTGRYMLLDGHLRFAALKELEETEVNCLVSTDDESFTYNKYFNHIAPIQEHQMILEAIERGVPAETIARALHMDINNVIRKKNLLEGICPEAVDLLKDKMVPCDAFNTLKRMGAMRQIEVATLMNDANIYSSSYAKALLAATPKEQLKDPEKPKKIKGLTDEQMARMENEAAIVQREFKLVEEAYTADIMNLVLAKGYIAHLLGNVRVVRYLAQNHPEFLSYFQKIAEMTSLDDKNVA